MNMITYQINQIATQFCVLREYWNERDVDILFCLKLSTLKHKKEKSYLQCYSTIVTLKKNKKITAWHEWKSSTQGLKTIYTDFIMIFGTKFKIQMHPKIHFGTSF